MLTAVLVFLSISAFGSDLIKNPFGFETSYQKGSSRSHFENNILTSVFPAGLYGTSDSGFNFGVHLPSKNSRTIQYEVQFDKSFDFVKGGKLPGLCGSPSASGGTPADGTNGFSARLMWRKGGRLVSYIYHVNQADIYGDDFQWKHSSGESIYLKPGIWHRVKFIVSVNDLGVSNGVFEGYFDDKLAFKKADFIFRTIPNISVDRLCFNTFFGGNDPTWAPSKDETLSIRNLIIE